MQKVYLKTMGFIWFVHMLLTGSISFGIIEQNRDLVNTFIIVSVVATVAMLILTIKYLKKGSEDKKEYSEYMMDMFGVSALCAEICIYRFGGYLSKNIPMLSAIVFFLVFVITGILYCNQKKIKNIKLIIYALIVAFFIYILPIVAMRRIIHYGIITKSIGDSQVDWIIFYAVIPIIILFEILGTCSLVRRFIKDEKIGF
ncbi:hypothetical protein [Lachnospira multipara]|uniref:hypothetical protein n=1 Tax=Lachnospira multipara TaxID=28051 RepID=UPI00048136A4|nr:hypothetical protein [Lachnospira multipara]